jgi:hypothetical protein
MSGRPTVAEVTGWAGEVAAVGERIGRHFPRSEPRQRAVGYIRGPLGDAERKSGRQLAEHLCDPTPDGVQRLLARADWDAGAVRDDLMAYVAEHLGGPGGVLVVDETGFLKKGTKSCGVARQYSGTAGRIENCQVGVFLGYAAARGHALIDRALYLPKEWADDRERRDAAGVPGEVRFATKLVLARRTVERAVAAGAPARWVTADAVYGSDYHFRAALEGRGLGYVVGVRADFAVCVGWRQVRAKALLAEVPEAAWHRLSCGAGAKGPRWYDWAVSRTNCPSRSGTRGGCSSAGACPTRPRWRTSPAAGRRHDPGRVGQGGRRPVGSRGVLRAGQGGPRAGRVRGAVVGRVAPARHPQPARLGGGGRDPVPGGEARAGGKGAGG